jgi:hypothetical protein
MAHHVRNHIAVGQNEKKQILETLAQEAIDEVASEEEDLRADLSQINVGGWVAGSSATLADYLGAGGWGRVAGGVLGGILQGQRQRRLQAAVARIEAIKAEKTAQQQQKWRDLNHGQEFESDQLGYVYAVSAGFKPQGCLTAMKMLSRLGLEESDTHPANPDRVSCLQQLSASSSTETLVQQGRTQLAASQAPLTYDLSRDRASLRINSKQGSVVDIDSALPK